MAYTVGIKKWWGYEKLSVTRHSWENFRFIFDLADGGQLIVPGFRASGVKVFPDFWDHVRAEQQKERVAHEAVIAREKALQERADLEEFQRAKLAAAKSRASVEFHGPRAPDGTIVGASKDLLARTAQDYRDEAEEYAESIRGSVNPEVYQNALSRVRGILQPGQVDTQ